ncbi:MAG: hypothetical protein Q9208_002751 [Pyrenodesmia sp. 3 TL-2023]
MTSQAAAFHAVLFWALPPTPPDIPYVTSTVKEALTATVTSTVEEALTATSSSIATPPTTMFDVMVLFLKVYLLSFIPFLIFSFCWFLPDLLAVCVHHRAPPTQVPARSFSSTLLAPFRYIGRLPKPTIVFVLCLTAWFVYSIRRELLYPYPYYANDYLLCGARFALVLPIILLFRNRDTLIADARNLNRRFWQGYARVKAFIVGCKNEVFRAGSEVLAWCGRCLATLMNLARTAGSGLAGAYSVTSRAIARTMRFVYWALSWLFSLIWNFLGWTVRTAIIYWPTIRHLMSETCSIASHYLRQWSAWRWNLFLSRFRDVIEVLGDGLKRKVYVWPHLRLASEIAANTFLQESYRQMVEQKDEMIARLVEWKGNAQVHIEDLNEKNERLRIFRFMHLRWENEVRAISYQTEAANDPVDCEGKDRLIERLRSDKISLQRRINNLVEDLKEKDEQCAKEMKLKDDGIKDRDEKIKLHDAELERKDVALKLKDDKIKLQDAEIKSKGVALKLKDDKIKEQVATIQGHEQREGNLTSTNMKIGKELEVQKERSAAWQDKAEELVTKQFAKQSDSSDAEQRAQAKVEDAAQKIVEAQSKAQAAETKAKKATDELESQKKANAELSAEHSKVMKENEAYQVAKFALERELAYLRELIPVDVTPMETEVRPKANQRSPANGLAYCESR